MPARIRLVPYGRDFLDRSWEWLNDPEIRRLTMTPDFTRHDQVRFFDGLQSRDDYRIWGLELEGAGPVGAAGIKNIRGTAGEYWGYIGEKRYWGQGLGSLILDLVEAEAASLGLKALDLRVATDNRRAIRLYEKCGYAAYGEMDGALLMKKTLVA